MNNFINFKFDDFFQILNKYILKINSEQERQFEFYLEFLLKQNMKFNLVSRNEKNNIIERHFFNSALIAYYFKFSPDDKVIDIGSGAGFPGIILKILFPQTHFTLIDSIAKKTNFLNELILKLNLEKIEIINNRVENFSKNFARKFDFVTARAVARLDELFLLSEPLISQHGTLIFLKGKNFQQEVDLFYKIKNNKNFNLNLHPLHELPFSAGGDGVLISIQHL